MASNALKVPAIFTAIDRFTGPVQRMSSNAEAAMARFDRNLRKVADRSFAIAKKSAVIGGAIIAPLIAFANESVKFEESMTNIATLIDTEAESMEDMGNNVLDLANRLPVPIEELTSSLYDIRSAGVDAGSAMETLEQSSMLAKAGLGEVNQATDLMTSSLNAFESEGLSAAETADIIFKTVKNGKTNIAELSQAFGATAPVIQSAGVKLADFQAATAALTTLGTPASQAQNQLRAAITSLQKPSEDMKKVFKALGVTTEKELIAKFGNMGNAFQAVNAEIEKLGLNQAKTYSSTEALAGVLSLTGATNETYVATLEDMTQGTNALEEAFNKQSQTGSAQMQVAKNNMKSLSITLGNALIPMINGLMKTITPMVKRFTEWAQANPGTVKTIMKVVAGAGALALTISAVATAVGIASKAIMLFRTIQTGWAAVTKAAAAAQAMFTTAIQSSAIATKIITAVQWLWNAAMMANPIGLIIAGVAALAVGVYALASAFDTSSDAARLQGEVMARAREKTLDQRVEVTMLFQALRKAEVGSDKYNQTLERLEQIQPGIIENYNLQAGALEDINRAEQDLIASIMERAKTEARAEMMKEKIKEAMRLEEEGPDFWSMSNFAGMFSGGAVVSDMLNQQDIASLYSDADILAQQQAEADAAAAETEVVDPVLTQQEVMTNNVNNNTNETVTIEFANAPEGMMVTGSGGNNLAMPGLGSTRGG